MNIKFSVDDVKPVDETVLRPYDLEFCVATLDPRVESILQSRKCCVAGGFVRDAILGEDIKDIDIFTVNEASARSIANSLLGSAPFLRLGGVDKHLAETGKALTVANGFKGPTPQVIYRWVFDDMSKVIDAFDFTIVQASFWWDGEKWVSRCAPTFYADLEALRLVYTSTEDNDVLGSVQRMLKFSKAGFDIDNDNLARLLADVCMREAAINFDTEDYHKSILQQLPKRSNGKY